MESRVIASELESNDIALGPLDRLIGYHMRRASAVLGSDFRRAVEDSGMRQVLLGILSVISANPGINQGAVGRALGIQRANMVTLVNELLDRALVSRETASDDRRAFALRLTEAGEAAVETLFDRIQAHEARLFAEFSAQERATLVALLRRLETKEG